MTLANGNTYQYDSQNELVGMNGGTVRLVYDGDGNRVEKTVNGVTTRYLVDDLNPTGYAQVVEETVNGAPQRTYAYGLQRISENQIVNSTWTPSFYEYDGMGSRCSGNPFPWRAGDARRGRMSGSRSMFEGFSLSAAHLGRNNGRSLALLQTM